MKFASFVEWAYLGLISFIAWQLNSNIFELQKAISQLNTQVSIVISENSIAKETAHDHEFRIRALEGKRK